MPNMVRFDCFEVDLESGELRKRGIRIKLRDQAFQVLAALLECPGRVVTREHLRQRLWREEVFVDFDNNLNILIARLREALGDSPEHPRFIETLPKRGYRFVADVSKPAAARPRLVVLPFANLSGDPAQDCFCDAVTDEIISALANVAPERLAVIARTTAMHYKGTTKDVSQIGRELQVDYLIEGSLRRSGGRVAVSAQLIQTSDQSHVWAKLYDTELPDIFGVETAIAQAVAVQLGITSGHIRKKPTEDLQAYNLYIEARQHLSTGRLPEASREAMLCLEQAIARDPEFALAYDSLAECYWSLGFIGAVPPKEALSTGMFYALRALEIDNTLAETHALAGQFRRMLDYNWADVFREMDRALQLNPASPVVGLRCAVTRFMPEGRLDEAVSELESVLELDPLSKIARCWLAIMLWLGRQYDRGLEQIKLVLEVDPTHYLGFFMQGQLYIGKQMFQEGVAVQCKATELSGGSPLMLGWLGLNFGQAGKTAEARAVLERLRAIAPKVYVPATSFAWTHLGLGELDEFFEWMDRAIDAREFMLTPIKTYPFFDAIRDDPRFAGLLRKMHLES